MIGGITEPGKVEMRWIRRLLGQSNLQVLQDLLELGRGHVHQRIDRGSVGQAKSAARREHGRVAPGQRFAIPRCGQYEVRLFVGVRLNAMPVFL